MPPRRLRALTSSLLVRESAWLVGAKLVQGACSFVAAAIVARELGNVGFGQLSLAVATAMMVATLATLGLEHVASREISQAGDGLLRPVLATLRRLRVSGAILGASVLLVAALGPFTGVLGPGELLLVLCLLPLAQVGDLSEWRLVAEGRARKVAIISLAVAPAAALARVGAAFAGAPLAAFAGILVAEWGLRSCLLGLAAGRTPAPTDAKLPAGTGRRILLDSAPLLLSGMAVALYMRLDQYMIAGMMGPGAVGQYASIVMLTEMTLVAPVILLRTALPILSRMSVAEPAAMTEWLVRLMRGCFYFHLAIALVVALFASPIVSLVFGADYLDAVPALRIHILSTPFVALGVISSAWLLVTGNTLHALHRTLLGLGVNAALNIFLIPRFGLPGAATATVVAQIVATWVADAFWPATRELFRLKARSLLPTHRQTP